MSLSRAEKSVLTDWWFTVDRMLLSSILAIAGAGVVLSLAASPAIAIKRGLPMYYFVERQLLFMAALRLGNGVLAEPRRRLVEDRKVQPTKAAVANMCRLLRILHAMARDGSRFDATRYAAKEAQAV